MKTNLEFGFARGMDWGPQEKVLWMGRASLWNCWLGILLAALAAAAGMALIWLDQPVLAPAGGFAAAILLVATTLKRLSRLYMITSQRVIAQQGVLSKQVTEIEMREIRSIHFQQSFLQRLLGIGNVEVSSAVKVLFQGISDPEEVKEMIRETRLGARGAPHG